MKMKQTLCSMTTLVTSHSVIKSKFLPKTVTFLSRFCHLKVPISQATPVLEKIFFKSFCLKS